MSSFIDDCISGHALLDEIDDYIERWHNGQNKSSLLDFLGMTKKEYSLFLKSSEFLPFIVKAHKEKKPIDDIINSTYGMAARSENAAKSSKIIRWLKSEGLWHP